MALLDFLRGPAGPQGPAGPPGPAGPAGAPGSIAPLYIKELVVNEDVTVPPGGDPLNLIYSIDPNNPEDRSSVATLKVYSDTRTDLFDISLDHSSNPATVVVSSKSGSTVTGRLHVRIRAVFLEA